MVQVIDTDLVPPGKRASYLFEAVEGSPLPIINLSRSRFKDRHFRASFSGRMFGNAFLTRFNANAVHLARASDEISERSSKMLLLALLHQGTYEQLFDYHAPFPYTRPGDLLLLDLDAPQSVTFSNFALTSCTYIPREYFFPFVDDGSVVKPALFRPGHELYGLLAACFRECHAMRDPTSLAASAALTTLSHIALLAGGLHPREHGDLGRSLQEARRHKAQQFIAAHCDDPRLDPRRVADHLRLSLRSLHLAFEETGHGIAARIQMARLTRAKDMLLHEPHRSTLDIALACGFNNLSTFYRAFSDAFGMPPGEFRKSRN